jgi:hypothetical protein
MKLQINEKQLNTLISKSKKEIKEDETGPPAGAPSATPTAGTSSTQSGGQGYPQVGKWESGVTRGPSNQIGVTKWSDIVGSVLKRGKSNPLK